MDGLVIGCYLSLWTAVGSELVVDTKAVLGFLKTHLLARFCWAKRLLLLLSSLFSQNKAHQCPLSKSFLVYSTIIIS
jgi:hypothetical protein